MKNQRSSATTLAALLFVMVLSFSLLVAGKKQLLLTAEEPGGHVGFYNTDGDLLGKVKVGYLPHEIIVTEAGDYAYVSNFGLHDYASPIGYAGYFVSVINVKLMLEERKLYTFAAGAAYGSVQRAPHGIKLSPDEKSLWVNCEYASADGTTVVPQMLVFDLTNTSSQEPARTISLAGSYSKAHNFVFSPDGSTIWLQLGAQGIATLNPVTGALGSPVAIGTSSVSVRGLVFHPDGKLIVSGAGELFAYDVSTSPPTKLKRYGGSWLVNQFLYPSVTPNGKYIIAPSTNGEILVIDYVTGSLVKRVSVFALDPVMVVITSDSKTGYASGARGGAITKIDLSGSKGQYSTEAFLTGVNAGPNGIVLVDVPKGGVDTDRDEFRVGAVLSLSGTGQPNGYKIKSALEMWKEGINQAGGIPLANGDAAEVVVKYIDDLGNASNTNDLLSSVLDDWDPHALIVAETGFAPTSQLLRALSKAKVPLVSVYALASTSKRSSEEEDSSEENVAPAVVDDGGDLLQEMSRRQLATGAIVGHDRWVDNTQYSSNYIDRFSRNATVIDAQATLAGLVLETAAFRSGRISGTRYLSAVSGLDTTFFYGSVSFSADGTNQGGVPVLVNLRG